MKKFRDLFSLKPRVAKVDLRRRFDLIGRVGQGSMSKVFRARDSMTGRMVALKVLDLQKTKRLEARFAGMNRPTEGEVALTLKHPYIVETFESGISNNDEQFLVMEFVQGLGLGYLIDTQNEAMQEHRLRIMIQLGEAIAYFHRSNWIHRDICPRNVLLDEEYNVKLIDFGLVVPNTEDFQKPGNRTGTPTYMAPELIKRQRTDQRIDIFSYAVSCYEMFTRKTPWQSGNLTLDMVVQHINNPPTDIRDRVPGIDPQLADVLMRGVAPRPQDRYSSVRAMVQELREIRRRLEPSADEIEVFDQSPVSERETGFSGAFGDHKRPGIPDVPLAPDHRGLYKKSTKKPAPAPQQDDDWDDDDEYEAV